VSKGPSSRTLAALAKAERRRRDDLRAADQRALKIKERGDRTALRLARENQQLREEKNNNVLAQWQAERDHYLPRDEFNVQHSAVSEQMEIFKQFMIEMRSGQTSVKDRRTATSQNAGIIYAVVGAIALIIGTLIGTGVIK
jgi:hypothetical protein